MVVGPWLATMRRCNNPRGVVFPRLSHLSGEQLRRTSRENPARTRQTAITTGPYEYVRHPIYASGLLSYLGTPLLLGSWYGLAIVPVMAALLAFRAVMEERMLKAELDGYLEYSARVRYRLLPLVW